MKTVPLDRYTPDIVIQHPNHAAHVSALQRDLKEISAFKLSVREQPQCTEIRTKTISVDPGRLKGTTGTERVWELGDLSRKLGPTYLSEGTGTRKPLPKGMAVLEVPECEEDPSLMLRATRALSGFIRDEERAVANKTTSLTFIPRGKDGKIMVGYNHNKTSEVELGEDGVYRHVQYSGPRPTGPVKLHYAPSLVNVLAELPRETTVFLVKYLKGLADLFGCDHSEIFRWNMMILEYISGGGFSRHIDGIKAFNNQAGIVILLSLSMQGGAKHLDLIPVSTLTKETAVRVTTKAAGETIIMSGLPRVDEPHSVPFDDAGLDPKGARLITVAIKCPFIESVKEYVSIIQSRITGASVQEFDAEKAIAAQKGILPVPALSVSAAEFTSSSAATFSVSATEFVPATASAAGVLSTTFSASAAEFVPTW